MSARPELLTSCAQDMHTWLGLVCQGLFVHMIIYTKSHRYCWRWIASSHSRQALKLTCFRSNDTLYMSQSLQIGCSPSCGLVEHSLCREMTWCFRASSHPNHFLVCGGFLSSSASTRM